ncbi:hypothetical protein RJ641_010457, partial [Dillenia turbinata]
RISDAVELLEKGKELQAQGDFIQALTYFTQNLLVDPIFFSIGSDRSSKIGGERHVRVLCQCPDLALDFRRLKITETSHSQRMQRVGRALALYEFGVRDEAIAEMEDVSISLKGYPVNMKILDSQFFESYEVHAALAAVLYEHKHVVLLAENQFAIATLLDPHYTDLSYEREAKHWPPSL